jgi:electron transfer flavoprotein beta subunit
VGLEGSLTHVIKTFAPKSERRSEMIQGDAKTAARTLVESFREKRLI